MIDLNVNVRHITRVEGHGNIVVDVQNGELRQCDLEIVEAPRFFEAMLRGRPYADASHLTSRICGICAVGHATTSLRAVEAALGIAPSRQTERLRRLNFLGEILDSHILHAYMLVAPDYLGAPSVLPLAHSAPHIVKRALRMKKVAGDICRVICGRHIHPIAMVPGGFTHYPAHSDLEELHARLVDLRPDVDATVALFQTLATPLFERETEYIALRQANGRYGFIDGDIASTDGGAWPADAYREITNEVLVQRSTAKHASHQRASYMVGALARFNINHDRLHPRARAAAEALGMTPMVSNPFLNTAAQVVEIVHCVEEGIGLLETLLQEGVVWEKPAPPARLTGQGTGAAEVPRGTLFHHYAIEDGVVVSADCVVPTSQNLANIELDMRRLVPQIAGRPEHEVTQMLEMLVRAYDPCISCSTHMLHVEFV